MKIVIANPPWPGEGYGVRSNSRWPHRRADKILPYPIYLAYAAAVLKEAGHEVYGLDGVIGEDSSESFAEKIREIAPELVVMETATPSICGDLKTAKKVKEKTKTHLCLIGPHATVFHDSLLKEYGFIDSIARGEYEYTVRDLVEALEKKSRGFSRIDGLTWRNGRKTIVNQPRTPIKNLDELPYPARDVFHQGDYVQGWYKKKTFMMITSRGCPARCTFCLWPKMMYGHGFRARSAENVVEEIEYLVNEKGAEEIDFDDDTMTMDIKRMERICDLIMKKKLNIQWRCFSRVTTITQELAYKMEKAGCYHVCFGIESGSQRILNDVKKGITPDQARKAVEYCKETGIETDTTFMLGFPNETEEDVRKTIELAKELNADYAQFSIMTPYPGTDIYEECEQKGLLRTKDWSEFDNCHGSTIRTQAISGKRLGELVSEGYLGFYLRPHHILRRIAKAQSIDDLKFIARGAKIVLSRAMFVRRNP